MFCAQLPAELDNQVYLTSDIAHRMKLITEGMVEHEAASGNVKRKFAPIFKLVNKLGAGADNANTADMLTHKIGELGVAMQGVNDVRKVIARECYENAKSIDSRARLMGTPGWARPLA